MDNLRFSVLTSVYINSKSSEVKISLESLIKQTLIPSQIVVVIDGYITPDLVDTLDEFKQFCESMVELTIVESGKNIGLGKALALGLKYVKTEWVARMDTDDICFSNRFETQVNYCLLNPNIDVCGAAIQEFGENLSQLRNVRRTPSKMEEILKFSRFRNPINHPTVFFRKHTIEAYGGYEHMPLFEDYFLWMKLIHNGIMFANLDEPLLFFRIGNDMIGRRHGMSYVVKEFNFLFESRKRGYISTSVFIKSLIVKLPLRLLPKRTLNFLYKSFLRK